MRTKKVPVIIYSNTGEKVGGDALYDMAISPLTGDIVAVGAVSSMTGITSILFCPGSKDPKAWGSWVTVSNPFKTALYTVHWSPYGWIAAGGGGLVLNSDDGKTWNEVAHLFEGVAPSINFVGSAYSVKNSVGWHLLAGTNGNLYESPNGKSWVKCKDQTAQTVKDICAIPTGFFLSCTNNTYCTYKDTGFHEWTGPSDIPINFQAGGVVDNFKGTGKMAYIVGGGASAQSRLFSSFDLKTWQTIDTKSPDYPCEITSLGDGSFVIVGNADAENPTTHKKQTMVAVVDSSGVLWPDTPTVFNDLAVGTMVGAVYSEKWKAYVFCGTRNMLGVWDFSDAMIPPPPPPTPNPNPTPVAHTIRILDKNGGLVLQASLSDGFQVETT